MKRLTRRQFEAQMKEAGYSPVDIARLWVKYQRECDDLERSK